MHACPAYRASRRHERARSISRAGALAGLGFLAALGTSGAAEAAPQSYSYKIEHPSYGDIGTYTESVDDAGGFTHIDARLRVAVKILGMVAYHEESDRKETWRDGRLLAFDSITAKNGKRIAVHGEAQQNHFVVTSPSGTVVAPADIETSDPRVLKQPGPGVIITNKLGGVETVEVSGGEQATVSMGGLELPTRHFRVDTESTHDKWDVWLNDSGVPVKFRSMEEGTPIEFTLSSVSPDDNLQPAPMPPVSQPNLAAALNGQHTH